MRSGGEAHAKPFSQALSAAVEMRPHGVDGQAERDGDALIAALFLVIEDEDGALDIGEGEKLLVEGVL